MNDIDTLRDALLIISGQKQCLDNLMGNADVAHQALAALERAEKRIDALHRAQGYVYIGKDGKAVLARELEDDRDALRKALDDRFAADLKAAKAIFAETGRTSGFPSVKEVVAYYMAEVERLRTENAALRTIISKCADALGNGAAISHDCSIAFMGELPSEIGLHVASLTEDRDTWKERSDSLRAKLERAKEALKPFAKEADRQDTFRSDDSFGVMIEVRDLRQARAVLSELSADAPAQQTFQERVQPWLMACFGQEISADKVERNHRFLEEALELVQACGCPCEDAHQLVDYVYNRPIGEPHQEVGGVQVTLAALCLANALDMHKAREDELARIWTKVDKIRAKQAAKPKGSPLPQHVAPAQQTQISDEVREAMVEAEKALTDLVADIRDYEWVNNLSPSPGKKDRWQSVTRADTALAKLRSVMK